ncbi:MAG TPA: SCO family protein [Lacunisphaera sp.]
MKTPLAMKTTSSTRLTTRNVCHTLYDKRSGWVCGLLLLGAVTMCGAEGTAGACCAAESAEKTSRPACCEAMASGAFSKNSLYQADASFTDDTGRAFTLGQLRGRPVVLTMFFASCGYACPLLVTDMQAIRGRLPAEQRDRALFVLVSFDTVRDTPEALAKYRAQRGLDGSWVLLHGDGEAIRELAALLGVKYQQETDGMFSHSNLITVLNAEGEVVHQRTGLKGGLDEAAQAVLRAGS